MNGEAVHLSFGTRPELKMQINCWNFSDKYVLGDNLLSTSSFLQKASVCRHEELDIGNGSKNKLFQQ